MTETQWLTGNLKKMLKYLQRRGSERKRRLFGVACCHRMWPLLRGSQCHDAMATAERYADGLVSQFDLSEAESGAHEASTICRDAGDGPNTMAADAVFAITCAGVRWDIAEVAASNAASAIASTAPRGQSKNTKTTEEVAQVSLLREIFGNPFTPVAFTSAWRTDTAMILARQMYESREFSALPILADALQDAGCDNEDLLNHCRDTSATHVRGCWALDLVLGKT